ncbi:MAG TPA: toll/interleukin-1 receptor domain-containing protein [Anaerolineae bacterium]|nr:toll/interleukin-1 receptor domain-containing protein [Anaerolineae bacterium]
MTAEGNDTYRYDVFISYSDHDREWVQGWLLHRLEETGLRVCIDFRDFELGVASLVNMENAVERSRKTLIVLTPEWVESKWTAFESLLIQTDDPAGRRARMIPLRLEPCEPPKRIAMLTYVDFTQPPEVDFQLRRLVASIRGESMQDIPRPAREEPPPVPTLPPTPPPGEAQLLPLVEKVKLSGQRVRGWLINVLQTQARQAIGGVVAMLVLMIAIGAWFWPDISAFLFPATPAATPPGNEVVIEMDGLVIDASDDRCQEVVCRSSPRIEAKVLDLTGVRLQPDDFSYNWRFDPPDPHNLDRLDSKIYAIIYSVPCDRDSQMITVEVLRNGKTLGVKGICFSIEMPP